MSIPNMWEKGKRLVAADSQFYGLILLLLGVTAFGLGRVSVPEVGVAQPAQIIFSSSSVVRVPVGETADTPTTAEVVIGQYVASKNGSKYHFPWCPGAKQMKEENQVWFNSVAEAKAAGYEPAANCSGLE